jgi:hypothetical protein
MTLAGSKRRELAEKLGSLPWEFKQWEAESERQRPLERHHTQIRAITNTLLVLASSIERELEPPVGGHQQSLPDAESVELTILELHRMWQFFRGKLALRYVNWFRSYLLVADDLAWSCYRPVQRWIGDDVGKEPPLVFFGGGSSPLMMPRSSAYLAEDVPGETLRTQEFQQALRHLPIPLVGIPWFQVRHLPDAALIGHEIGHDVEEDLRLAPRLRSILDAALEADAVDPSHAEAWRAWLGEVFADVYGTLAMGPAFASALVDFVAADLRKVAGEWRGAGAWGSYPTRALRVRLVLAVLDRCEFCKPARELRARWDEAYPTHQMQAFEHDVETVVRALIEGPYPQLDGGPLTDLISFSGGQQEQAEESAHELLCDRRPPADDIRCLAAAARLAYDLEPDRYLTRQAAERVLRKVEAVQTVGTRAGHGPSPAQALRDARDAAAGQGLSDFIARAHARRRDGPQEDEHV